MVPDTQKVWTDGRNGRTDTRTTQKSDLPTSSGDNSERESRVQQHVSKYYARRHPPLTLGVKIQLFLEHGHVAYQRELGMQQHGSKCEQRYNKKETYQT